MVAASPKICPTYPLPAPTRVAGFVVPREAAVEIEEKPRRVVRKKVAETPPTKKVVRKVKKANTISPISSLEISDVVMDPDNLAPAVIVGQVTLPAIQQCSLVCFNEAGTETIAVDFHGIKMDIVPCHEHYRELLVYADKESDRGLCHVCSAPIKMTYWQHTTDDKKRCHGACTCPQELTEGRARVYFNETPGEDLNSKFDAFKGPDGSIGGMMEPRMVR